MQPLISYYNGKENYKNIDSLLALALKTSLAFAVLFFGISQLFPNQLVSLFINPSNRNTFLLAIKGLDVLGFGFLICGFNIVLAGYFTALKETVKGTVVSTLRGYILITLTLLILPNIWESFGIWISSLVCEILTLGIALTIYTRFQTEFKDIPL